MGVSSAFASFKLIHIPLRDAGRVLALEEVLLKHSGDNFLMLWQTEPAVIIGKYQDVLRETSPAYLEAHEIALFRRFTGGGAIYSDAGNLNISFIGDAQLFHFDAAVEEMLSFLESLGVYCRADERRSLFMNGFKVSGSAQSIYKNRKIFHATLLVEADLEQLSMALRGDNSLPDEQTKPSVASHRSAVTNVGPSAAMPLGVGELRRAWLRWYRQAGLPCLSQEQTRELLGAKAIERLREEKYLNKAWTHLGVRYNNTIKI